MFLAAIASVGLMVGSANATVTKGVYVNVGGTADLTQTQHATASGYSSSQVGHAQGFGGNAAVGYGFGNGLRVEVEGLYLQSHVNRISPEIAHGHDQSFGGMVNVLYDIDLKRNFGINSFVTPYVGVGAGYLVDQYNTRANNAGGISSIRGAQGSFGYQGIVGASFDTGVPGLQAFADYRMIGQTMSKDSYSDFDSHFDHKFNHTFNVGLRYAFDTVSETVPVAPVVIPAPAPARTYLVFFDWDKYDLNRTAKQVVDKAAEASRNTAYTRILVNGYSDTSSARGGVAGKEYNQKLSNVRAEHVADELIAKGVPSKLITVTGFGQSHLLVQTGPNVREPQNRRVEIIIQ